MNTATDRRDANADGTRTTRIAICGGGSGGHLTPGIAIAAEAQRRSPQASVTFLTSCRTVDRRVLRHSLETHPEWKQRELPITGRGRWSFPGQLIRSFRAARQHLKAFQPDVVIGTGGFASVPSLLAAAMQGTPIFLLECNSLPGRANRTLNRLAQKTFCGLPLKEKFLKRWRSEIEVTGVPLRADFGAKQRASSGERPTILILGGSQGASGLNELVVEAFADCFESWKHVRVLHQAGERDAENVRQRWGDVPAVTVVAFIDELSKELNRATVVVSRAGAVAIAEIAAAGRPAVLVPLPGSADGHQVANAAYVAENGAGVVVDQSSPDAAEQLRAAVCRLIDDGPVRQEASAAATALAKPEAAREIVSQILQCSSD